MTTITYLADERTQDWTPTNPELIEVFERMRQVDPAKYAYIQESMSMNAEDYEEDAVLTEEDLL